MESQEKVLFAIQTIITDNGKDMLWSSPKFFALPKGQIINVCKVVAVMMDTTVRLTYPLSRITDVSRLSGAYIHRESINE